MQIPKHCTHTLQAFLHELYMYIYILQNIYVFFVGNVK